MGIKTSRLSALAASSALWCSLLLPTSALAEPPPSTSDVVPVSFVSKGDLRLKVSINDAQTLAPIASCTTPCIEQVGKGRYLVEVDSTGSTFRGTSTVVISGPERVVLSPSHRVVRYVGLGLGIVGPTLLVASIFVYLNSALSPPDTCANEEPCPTHTVPSDKATTAAALAISGLVLTPVGWVLFGTSHGLGVEQAAAKTARRAAPRSAFVPTLGATPLRGGGAFSVGFVF